MTMTGLTAFDTTIQKTDSWLKDLQLEMGIDDRQRAYVVLRTVLHTLRDRLGVAEVADFAAQMPMLLRGLYYEDWVPAGKPDKTLDARELLRRVAAALWEESQTDPVQIVRAVFTILERRISAGEISDIRNNLPHDWRELWEMQPAGAVR